MKIATVLSVSALFAVLSAVACSSPTVPAADDSDKAADKETTGSKSTTKAPAAANSSTTTTTTGTAPATGADPYAACDSCIAAKSPKYAAAMKCGDACDPKDDDCDAKCFEDSCGSTPDDTSSECGQAIAACKPTCDAAKQTAETACKTCLAPDATAAKIPACLDAAGDDQAKNDACFTGCDDGSSCDKQLDTCEAQCGI